MDSSSKGEASKKIIDETIRLYSNILSRPLDRRQLARPSFKFIQELVKDLMIETRTLRDAFTTHDFDPKLTADRQFRFKFIQKLIEYVARNGRPVINCLAARVVAGLESNKTNELLQSLGKVARQQVSAKAAQRPRTFTRTSIPSETLEKQQQQQQPPVLSQTLPEEKQQYSWDSVERKEETFTSPTKASIPQKADTKSIKEESKSREESTKSTKSLATEQQVYSESDVAKNIQQLQLSLRTLVSELVEISQLGDIIASFSTKNQAQTVISA